MTRATAIASYRAARDAYYEAGHKADAAFAAWFTGEKHSPATVSRMENKVNECSVHLYNAQSELFAMDIDPWTIDDEDGVDRTPVGH